MIKINYGITDIVLGLLYSLIFLGLGAEHVFDDEITGRRTYCLKRTCTSVKGGVKVSHLAGRKLPTKRVWDWVMNTAENHSDLTGKETPKAGTLHSKTRYMRVAFCLFMGLAVGVGAYTFIYAEGGSYLSNEATACANCHVMQSHYDAWIKSTHHDVAVCNDCHAPHDSFVDKYIVKGKNGFNHSLAFTTGRFTEPIQITPANKVVTEESCRACHADVVHVIDLSSKSEERMSCIRCHRDVGHPR